MNTIELKRELINRISKIEDVDFLNAIKTILDYKRREPFIELTPDQEYELSSPHSLFNYLDVLMGHDYRGLGMP